MASGWRFVLIAVLAALALASCGDDKTAGDKRTLTYFEGRGTGGPPTFFGGQRPGGRPVPGGGVAGTLPLEDADGNAVAEVNSFCIVTGSKGGGKHTCSGTVDVPDGQLNIAYGGDIKGGLPVTGSITGGTGDYAGATGTYKVEKGQPPKPGRRPGGVRHTFTFTLP